VLATAAGPVTVGWAAPRTAPAEYRIVVTGSGARQVGVAIAVSGNENAATVRTLATGAVYTVDVFAVNSAGGKTAQSPAARVAIATIAPSNVRAAAHPGGLAVRWHFDAKVVEPTAFVVAVGDGASATLHQVDAAAVTAPSGGYVTIVSLPDASAGQANVEVSVTAVFVEGTTVGLSESAVPAGAADSTTPIPVPTLRSLAPMPSGKPAEPGPSIAAGPTD